MRTLVLALTLTACGWNSLPNQSGGDLEAPLWDPFAAVPTQHGVYVPLPHAGGLALIEPTGSEGKATRIDIGEGRLTRLTASPDGQTLVAFVERTACDLEEDEGKPPTYVFECDNNQQVVTTELSVIRGTDVDDPVELDGVYNAIEWSDDGSYAIAYLDFSDPNLRLDGVVNLTSVVTLDLTRNQTTPVSVGFAADRVLFVEGADGSPERAVVLSQNSVAVIDLLPDIPVREVTFPLTLDPDSVVTPVGVELTPNGQYALITVAGRSDLYALDLLTESINIVELSSVPSAMAVNPALDRTVLVYGGGTMVDILEHDLFDLDTLTLDEPMTNVQTGSNFAVLYNTRNEHDAYKLDLETNVLTEYRLQNPAVAMHIAPTEEFAIALTRAEDGFGGGGNVESIYDANPGMEILDLRDDDSSPYLLEGNGLGVAWSQTPTALFALILQQEVDYLYKLDLYTGRNEELELSEPPVTIGAMPDGDFFITHTSPLGLITFLNPLNGETTEVRGFATLGLADEIELIELEEGKN